MRASPLPGDFSARSWGVVWTCGLVAMLPLLTAYLVDLWRLAHYRYFPVAILLSAGLIGQRWDRQLHPPEGITGWLGIVVSLLLLIAGGLLLSPWLGAVAFVTFAAAFLFSHRGESGGRLMLAWLPLVMLVRLPLDYDQRLMVGLQGATTRVSSYLLDLFAISHRPIDHIIQLPDRELLIAEVCGGVQSAFTLCFVVLAIVAIKRRPLLVLPFAISFALLWALAANVVRVTVIALAATVEIDLSTGWPHEILSYVVFLMAIGMAISSDHLLHAIFHPTALTADFEDNYWIVAWDWLTGANTGAAQPSPSIADSGPDPAPAPAPAPASIPASAESLETAPPHVGVSFPSHVASPTSYSGTPSRGV